MAPQNRERVTVTATARAALLGMSLPWSHRSQAWCAGTSVGLWERCPGALVTTS